MARPDIYISLNEAEESHAVIVLMIGVLAIIATCLALWIGFRWAETHQGAKPSPILVRSEMTKAEIKALNIIQPTAERH